MTFFIFWIENLKFPWSFLKLYTEFHNVKHFSKSLAETRTSWGLFIPAKYASDSEASFVEISHCSIGKDSPDAPTWKIWEPMLIEVWSILVLVLAFVIAQVSFIFGRPNRNKTKICLINQKLNEIESLNKKWQPTRQCLSMGGSLGLLLCVRV